MGAQPPPSFPPFLSLPSPPAFAPCALSEPPNSGQRAAPAAAHLERYERYQRYERLRALQARRLGVRLLGSVPRLRLLFWAACGAHLVEAWLALRIAGAASPHRNA